MLLHIPTVSVLLIKEVDPLSYLLAVAPHLNDVLGEWFSDDFEQVRGVLARLDVKGVDNEFGELVQDACGRLQG